jgi:signal transduction histidine kinase
VGVKYVHRVIRIGDLTRRHWFDLLIAGVGVAAMVEIVVGQARPGSGAPTTTLWFCLPAIAVLVSPLFLRRRFPFAAPAAYWVLAVAVTYVDWGVTTFPISLFLAGMASAFLLGNLRNALQAGLGLSIPIVGSAIVVSMIPGHSTAQMIFIPLQFAISWLAGFAVRESSEQAEAAEQRAQAAERERDFAARVAVAEERARIARELHDIVAHAVSVMVLQVGAVRHKLPEELGEDRNALNDVERAGRTALTEMRRLLAAMRRDDEEASLGPQPGLDALALLLAEVERAGLPVQLHVDGEPFPLPRGIELSAYRIVQEGLTNALKHAHASTADVTLRYGPRALQLEIRDDGVGSSTSDGLGHGLVGIRERVKIYGGEMSTETANGGGFVLSTRLPLDRDRA